TAPIAGVGGAAVVRLAAGVAEAGHYTDPAGTGAAGALASTGEVLAAGEIRSGMPACRDAQTGHRVFGVSSGTLCRAGGGGARAHSPQTASPTANAGRIARRRRAHRGTTTADISPLSLHDALPISTAPIAGVGGAAVVRLGAGVAEAGHYTDPAGTGAADA